MISPAVRKTPVANNKKTPTPSNRQMRQSNGAAVVTPAKGSPGKIVKTPPAKNGKQTPVAKGKKEQPKKNIEEEEEEEEVDSGDEDLDVDEDVSTGEDGEGSDVDDNEEMDAEEDESSEGEEVPLPEGSVSGDSPDEDEEPVQKTPAQKGKPQSFAQDDFDNKRTVFVGNLPSSIEKKPLIKWFSKFGKVESVRFRSAPIADLKIPKKTAVITKTFHENATSINAYVKFTDETSAKKALKANGEKIDDTHHLRVDSVGQPKEMDNKKAIFVGNLPFDATEDELRELFADCGDLESVRVIRDPLTHVGKGFGYVNFTERNSVQLVLQKGEVKLKGKTLRLKKTESRAAPDNSEKPNYEERPNGVYVANMPYDFMTEDKLKDLFKDCGTITHIRIPKNGPKLRGFAIVNFSEPSGMDNAMKKAGEKIGDRALVVRRAGGGARTVSIDHIKPEDNSIFGAVQCLDRLLNDLTDVTSVEINKRGNNTEFAATVGFETPDSAKMALSKNGTRLDQGTVVIALVESKSAIKHQQMRQGQKRKFDFNSNKKQGFNNKRPKFDRRDNYRFPNGAESFQGVETSKKASVEKKIALKNVKKQKTQQKKEVLKKILNKDS